MRDAGARSGRGRRLGDGRVAERLVDRVQRVLAQSDAGRLGVGLNLFRARGPGDGGGELGQAQHPGERQLAQGQAGLLGNGAQALVLLQRGVVHHEPAHRGLGVGGTGGTRVAGRLLAWAVLAGQNALGQR